MSADSFDRELVNLPRGRTALLPALLLAEQELEFVSDEAIERIAAHLRLTVNEIEGVTTAYPDLHRSNAPSAETIHVCTGTACLCAGAGELLERLLQIQGSAGISHPIAVEETACAFLCGVAPIITVRGQSRGRVTSEDLPGLIALDTEAGS